MNHATISIGEGSLDEAIGILRRPIDRLGDRLRSIDKVRVGSFNNRCRR